MAQAPGQKALEHVYHLASTIGARPVGSAANRAAGEYVAGTLAAAGLAVQRLDFDCPDWTDHGTTLTLNGVALEAAANTWSPPCDVAAPVTPVCTLAELEAAELAGRIALLYGELSHRAIAPRNYPLYQIERDQQIDRLLETKGLAAALTVQHSRGLERILEDADLPVPSATIGPGTARRLLDGGATPVHLRIASERTASTSAHIIGVQAGPRPERILICAHYDTKIGTPGAWDNASGCAALLALAEEVTAQPLGCGLEFVAFTDEEYLGNDSQVYLARRGEALQDVIAVINFDGVGQRLAATTLMLAAGSPELQAAAEAVTAQFPALQWVEPWPESSHSIFTFQGIPGFALSNRPHSPHYHLPGDTPDWLDGAKLAEAVTVAAALVRALADQTPAWARGQTGR